MIIVKELHIHLDGDGCMLDKLAVIEANQTLIKELIMATKDEVLDAIAAEGAEVTAKIAELQTKIEDLIAVQAPPTWKKSN